MTIEQLEAVLYNLGEDDEAHLILTEEVGEGAVHVGKDFQALPSLAQADLLQDWITDLQEMYDSVIDGTFLRDLGLTEINEPPGSDRIN